MSKAQAEAPEQVQKQAADKPKLRLPAPRFKQADLARNVWTVHVPEGHTLDDLKDPEYWQHIAQNLRPGDRIEALWDDMSAFVDLLVLSAARLHAYTHVVNYIPINQRPDESAYGDNLTVMYRGPHHRYAVMNAKDVVQHGFDTSDLAQTWLMDYRKNILRN